VIKTLSIKNEYSNSNFNLNCVKKILLLKNDYQITLDNTMSDEDPWKEIREANRARVLAERDAYDQAIIAAANAEEQERRQIAEEARIQAQRQLISNSVDVAGEVLRIYNGDNIDENYS